MKPNVYKAIYNNFPAGITIIDEKGDYLAANSVACNLLGYSEKELLWMNFMDLICNKNRALVFEKFNRMKQLVPYDYIINVRTKSGDARVLNCHVFAIDENKFASWFQDVTDRIKIEKDQQSKKRYFELANVIFLTLDTHGLVQDINNKGCELLGYSKEDILGKDWFVNFVYPDDLERVIDAYYTTVDSGNIEKAEHFENRILTKDYGYRQISWHNSIIKNELGEVDLIISVGNDITDIRKTQETLVVSERKYRSLFENPDIDIAYYSLDGRILSLNRKAACDLGGIPSDFIGKSVFDVGKKKNADLTLKHINETLMSQESKRYETLIQLPKGPRWFLSIYSRAVDFHGNVTGIYVAAIDITKEKELSEENKQA